MCNFCLDFFIKNCFFLNFALKRLLQFIHIWIFPFFGNVCLSADYHKDLKCFLLNFCAPSHYVRCDKLQNFKPSFKFSRLSQTGLAKGQGRWGGQMTRLPAQERGPGSRQRWRRHTTTCKFLQKKHIK